jgi:hydroxypyruvate isomerase
MPGFGRYTQGFSFAVNTSMIFTELPLAERPAAVASAGFNAVESWWPFPGPVPAAAEADSFVGAIADAGVSLVALNFYAGDAGAGERGVVSVPGREQEFRDSVSVLVALAERTGCRRFNALYGQRVPGAVPASQDELALENLAFAADAVGRIGGTVLLEPLTRGENGDYPLLTGADVLAVADRLGAAGRHNVALLVDVYHLTNNGDSPARLVRDHSDRVGHVQLADAPGRHEPGTGTIDFGSFFSALAERSYDGFVALEYRPSGASLDSLGWLPPERRRR